MNPSTLTEIVVIGAVVASVISGGFASLRKRRRSPARIWKQFMRRIVPVDYQAIETVALDAVEPSGQRRSDEQRRMLSRQQVSDLLGGMKGIRAMEDNSHVLSEIVDFFERSHPETADLADEIRLEGRALAWHTKWLHEAEKNNCLELHFYLYGQNAAISYYSMVTKARALFQHSETPSNPSQPFLRDPNKI